MGKEIISKIKSQPKKYVDSINNFSNVLWAIRALPPQGELARENARKELNEAYSLTVKNAKELKLLFEKLYLDEGSELSETEK